MPLDANYSGSTQVANLGTKLAGSFGSVAAGYVVYPVTFLASGTLTVGANKAHEFPVVFDAGALPTIVSVTTRVKTAPTGQALLVDVNKNGTTIFTTQGNRPSIAAGAKTSAIMVPDVTVLASLDILSVDVDQVGSGVAGADLCVVVLVRQRAVFP